jgi:hypothetical protein
MAELIFVALIGLACFGIGLKFLMHKCDIKDEIEVNLIVNNDTNDSDNEVPPKYEDI